MRTVTARIAHAVGAVAMALAGCYDVPQPACGFTCGPPTIAGGEGTCPEGYVCFTSVDNRCHRVSPPFTDPCPGDAAMPVDLRPPQLTFRSPAPGDENVPLTLLGLVEVGFDEPVARIADFPNFVVEDSSGIIPGTVSELGQTGDGIFRYVYQAQRSFFSDTLHTVRLTDGIIDFSGNNFVGAEWTFRTEVDETSPIATVITPSTVVNVPVSTTINVDFNEAVIGVNATTFTLTGPSGNVLSSLVVGTANASLDPLSNLLPDAQYTITLTSAITDLAGNPLAFAPLSFRTANDITPPFVTTTTPADGLTNVSVLASVSASFSEPVTNVNGTTFTLTGPSGVEAAIVGTGAMTATLNPVYQLLPNTSYTVALSTAIVDVASNPLTAFTSTFTTGTDSIVPIVLATSPANGQTNVPVNTVVRVDWDEHVTNVDETTFQLLNGGAVAGTVAYQGAPDLRATFTPTSQLAPNTTYTILLTAGIQDASGNGFIPPASPSMFTTGADTILPSIATTSPADNATDVPLDATISVTFDEPVTGVDDTSFVVMNAGTGTLASSNGGRTWTFTPDAPMPANTTVTIMLTMVIEDASGNELVPVAFDFTTVP